MEFLILYLVVTNLRNFTPFKTYSSRCALTKEETPPTMHDSWALCNFQNNENPQAIQQWLYPLTYEFLILLGVDDGLGVSLNADGQKPFIVHNLQRGLRGVHIVCPKPTYLQNTGNTLTQYSRQTGFFRVQYKTDGSLGVSL